MLNKISLIIGIIFILYFLTYFIINNTTHITGYEILGASGIVLYNKKTVGSDYEYEKYIYQNDNGEWINKNDIRPHKYVDPSNTIVRIIAKIISYFAIMPFLSLIILITGVILTIFGLCGI